MKKLFWLCGDFFPGTGRLSRPWVESRDDDLRPDSDATNAREFDGTPYPFNMNARVIAGPFDVEGDAWKALGDEYP